MLVMMKMMVTIMFIINKLLWLHFIEGGAGESVCFDGDASSVTAVVAA